MDIRLLVTNDFFGSYFTQRASWGVIPGGRALQEHIQRLRQGADHSAWIDAGDFAAGGPLAPASDGVLAWEAAAALGFDAAVPGNHEFDFGDRPAQDWASRLPYPLIAVDTQLQQWCEPSYLVTGPNGRSVLVIGLTLAERRGQEVWDRAGDLDAGAAAIKDVLASTRAGRDSTPDHVAVVVHDGVPATGTGDAGHLARLPGFCAALRDHVDVVVGGHTLQRHVGDIAGVPYVQPWALGVEVGTIDFGADGVTVGASRVIGSHRPGTQDDRGWDGPGCDLDRELRRVVIGELSTPLVEPAGRGGDCFGDAVAQGLLAQVADADVALVSSVEAGCGQIPLDGITTYVPAGPVSEADVLRALPWPGGTRGDEMWAAELDAHEIDTLNRGLDLALPGQRCHRAARKPGKPHGVTLVSSNYVRNAASMLRRDVLWQPVGAGLRDGLRAYLTASRTGP